MAHALYQIASNFDAVRSTIAAGLDPGLFDEILHIVVYSAAREDRFDSVAAAREFAAYLDLSPKSIDRHFTRPSRADAETICTNVAEFGLVTQRRTMPHGQAAALAAAWVAQFDEGATFFSNLSSVASPIDLGRGYDMGGLFYRDHEAGVLAVSPTKAGLFWAAEDS
jgi:hypothetical protein